MAPSIVYGVSCTVMNVDCIDLDNGDFPAEFRCLRGLQMGNYYSTKMYQYFVNHTDGPDKNSEI